MGNIVGSNKTIDKNVNEVPTSKPSEGTSQSSNEENKGKSVAVEEIIIPKVIATTGSIFVAKKVCPEGQIWYRGKCREIIK